MVLALRGVSRRARAATAERIRQVRVLVAVRHEIARTSRRRGGYRGVSRALATFTLAVHFPVVLACHSVSRGARAATAERIRQVRVLVAVRHEIATSRRRSHHRARWALATFALAVHFPMVLACHSVSRGARAA